jgi:hypothetical protein
MQLELKYQSKKGNKYFCVDSKFNSVVIESEKPLKVRKGNTVTIQISKK